MAFVWRLLDISWQYVHICDPVIDQEPCPLILVAVQDETEG
jgi:hypothetical protein